MATRFYLTVCAIVKDESPYLEEWIEYHRLLGVEHFYLYDNDSLIPVSETLCRQISDGYVSVKQVHGREQQLGTYNIHSREHRGEAVWTAFLDVDEFITPRWMNDLPELLREFEAFGGLVINWQVFGGGGHATRPDDMTIASYSRRLPIDHAVNHHVKTIARLEDIRFWPNPHRPVMSNGVFPVNEAGIGIVGPFAPPSTQRVQINHYYTRSAAEWSSKVSRGRADTHTSTRTQDEGLLISAAAVEIDELADRFANAVRRVMHTPHLRFPHDVAGWLGECEGHELGRLATGRRVLEIGSYCGRSTICLAQRAKSVIAVDTFDGRSTPINTPTLSDFWANIYRYGVENIVQGRQGTSDDICPSLPVGGFDMVFIDGTHDEPSVDADIRHARRALATGGVLCGYEYHDSPLNCPGVKTAVDRFVYRTGARLRRLGSLWIADWRYHWEEV
jgi:hypothetical protein